MLPTGLGALFTTAVWRHTLGLDAVVGMEGMEGMGFGQMEAVRTADQLVSACLGGQDIYYFGDVVLAPRTLFVTPQLSNTCTYV